MHAWFKPANYWGPQVWEEPRTALVEVRCQSANLDHEAYRLLTLRKRILEIDFLPEWCLAPGLASTAYLCSVVFLQSRGKLLTLWMCLSDIFSTCLVASKAVAHWHFRMKWCLSPIIRVWRRGRWRGKEIWQEDPWAVVCIVHEGVALYSPCSYLWGSFSISPALLAGQI